MSTASLARRGGGFVVVALALLCCLWMPGVAQAQSPVHEEVETGASSPDPTSVATSASLTSVADHLYLAAVSTKSDEAVSSVTGLGLTWTLVQAQCGGRAQTRTEVWKAQGSPTGDSTVTANFGSAPANAVIAVHRYSGVDTTDAVGNSDSANTNGVGGSCSGGTDSSSYSFSTLDTQQANSVVFSAVGIRSRTHTAGTGYTERAEINTTEGGGSDAGVGTQDQLFATSTTNLTVSGSTSSDVDWSVVAVEILAVSGPTISDIADQSTDTDTATPAIPFTISPGSATVSGTSSNQTLVPNGNITFGGSLTSRTVTLTPAAGETGTATITVTVDDTGDTVTDTFDLTVSDPNQRVLSGTATIGAGNSSTTANFAQVNMNRAFLVFSTTVNDGDPSDTLVRGQLTNPTTATFTRYGTGPAVTVTWSVVEYASGVSVQRGSDSTESITVNLLLSSVNTAKSIPISTFSASGTTHDSNDFLRAQITSSTNLRLTSDDTNPDRVVEWQVVEFTNAAVQAGDISFGTGDTSKTDTLTSVNTSKSWLLYSFKSPTGTAANIGQKLVRGRVTNATTVTFDRNNTGQAIDLTWYLVEFTDSTSVQHDSQAFTAGETQKDVTLTSVDLTKSFAVGGSNQQGGRSSYSTDDIPGVGWMTHDLTSATNLRITRALTGSASADIGWFVIEIPNVPPTISDITNQATNEDTATGALPFTIGDVETAPASLTVTGSSSNTSLVPNGNIVFGGSGASRTVTLTPAADQTGVATITVTVDDGTDTTTDTFDLTVNAVNDPPTISDITDKATNEDTPTSAIAFTIGDVETAPASLTVSGTSSDQAVVANADIVFGGSGASRTVTITPVADATGTATITVTVNDGTTNTTDTFVLTVNAVNDPPTISDIGGQSTDTDTATAAIPFTIGDVETAPASLTVTGTSDDQALAPNGNIVFGGSGANRTVTITPGAGQTGTATITVTVDDGTNTTTDTFVLGVTDAMQGVQSGTATISAATTSTTATFTAVNLNRAYLVFSATTNDVDPQHTQIRGQLTEPTKATFTRVGSGAAVTIEWSVVEYSSGVTVQRGTVNGMAGTTENVTLSTVDTAKSIPIVSQSINGGSHGNDDYLKSKVTSSTNLEFTVVSANVQRVVEWQVVEFANAAVQTGDIAFGTGDASKTDTLTSVDTSKSWLLYSFSSDSGTTADIGQKLVRGAVTNSTTLTFDRNNTGQTMNLTWYLVEFTDSTSVQHASEDFTTAETQQDVTITSVDTARSFAVGGGMGRVGRSPYAGDDNPGVGWMTLDLTSSTNLRITRSLTGSATADMGWFVVQIPNVAPTISDITNQATNEDTATGAIGFTIGDVETAEASLTVTGSSSNTSLVPNGNIVFGGSGANRTVTLTPAAEQNGVTTITITVDDGTDTATDTFDLTVNAVNDPPTISDITDKATNEDTATGAIGFTIGDIETAPGSLTVSGTSSDQGVVANADIVFGGSGASRTVTITPVAEASGAATITVTVNDGTTNTTDTFVLTVNAVNDPPTISDITDQATNEDTATGAIAFTIGDVETAPASLTVSGTSSDQGVVANADIVFGGSGASGTVTITPVAEASGAATITVTVNDGTTNTTDTFVLTVNGVNDPPTISDITDQATNEDTATGAIGFTIGDVETPAASLTVSGTSSDQGVVANADIVFGGSGASRTVTITPVAEASGTATITVTVNDGTTNTTDTFVLTVNAVNDPPTISDITDQATNEDTATGAIAFTIGDVETAPASLTVSGTSSDQGVVANADIVFGGSGASRTVTITPVAEATGRATITVTVNDGTTNTTDTFVLTVNAVNDPPTISDITDQATNEDTATGAIGFTIGDVETAPASLTVSGTSSDQGVVANADIVFGGSGASRTVTITPVADATGTATITVTVNDGTTNTTDTFVLTVNGVNDPPTISDITDQATNEDTATGAIGFTIGDVETAPASLTVSGTSSDQGVVANADIVFGGSGASRTVTITPVAEASGAATITVTVNDGTTNTTDTFVLTVNAVNDPPTISDITDQATNEDTATGAIGFTIGDVETAPASLTVSGTSSDQGVVANGNIVFGGSGASRTVTITPVAEASGTATITVTVNDGTTNTTDTFVLTVNAVNDPPTISDITDQATNEDTATGALAFTIGDVETAPASLTVSGTSSDQGVVADGSIVFGGSGASRTVTITPVAEASGTATITVTVNDGTTTTTDTFVLTVNAVNDVPTISDITDQATNEDTATGAIGFTIGDVETAPASLTVSGTSSDQGVVADGSIVFGGSGASRTVTVTPVANASGTATITVTVSDGTATATDTFVLTVNAVNDVPTISDITDQATPEDTPTGALAFTIGDVETAPASLTVSGTSSNQTLVTNGNLVFGGSGASRTVTITPETEQSGTTTITITVSDGTDTATDTFVLTVNAVNDPPTISDITDQATNENTATDPIAFTIGDVETAPGALTVTGSTSDQTLVPNANLVFGGSGANRTVTITPAPDQTGTATITITVSDGVNDTTDPFDLTVTVNTVPTISAIGDQATPEDTATGPIAFTVGDAETAVNDLVVTATSNDQTVAPDGNITIGGSGASRTVDIAPAADQNGIVTITVTVDDGQDTTTETFDLDVQAVNDVPTISDVTDQSTPEDTPAGPFAFTVGDVETAPGSLVVTGSSSNQTVVPNGNITFGGSGASRTVTVTPASNQSGTATITVTVSDGTDTATDMFDLTVTAVNDPPTISDITNQSTPEDTAVGPIGFTIADVETPAASLTVTGSSSDQGLIPNGNLVFGGSGASRTITITPAADQNGSATITVTVSDGTATGTDTFDVTVTAVNDPPTISDIGNQSTAEDTATGAIAFTIGDTETAPASLTVTGSSDDQALIPNANIVFGGSGASRTVTITPAADQTGTATITVTVSDGTDTATDTFDLTVTAVNDPPTISDIGNQSTPEDTATSPIGFTIGDVETAPASLTVTGSSDDQALIPDGNIVFGGSGASRTVTITPALNQTGTATITVTVSDGTDTATDTFDLTVTAVNDPPTISDIGNQSTPANTPTGAIAFTIGDAETAPASLTVTGSSSDQTLVPDGNLVFGGSGASRTVTITPATDQSGTATITITVSDGTDTATDTFVLTVTNVLPTISDILDQSTPTNTSTGALAFTVGDAETAPASLTLAGTSSDQTLVPDDNLVFGGSGASRTISILPAGNQSGVATITVTVSDGTDTATDTFDLTVTNQVPTITDILDQSTPANTSTGALAFTVGDSETPAASLTVSGSSSDQTLVPDDNLVFGGSGANRTISILPSGDQYGTATITVTVSDGSDTATDTFVLTVSNTAPTISDISDQGTSMNTSTGALAFTVGDTETAPASLTVSGSSSDQTLVPDDNLVFGGSGATRTVSILPAGDQTGTATITVTVSDGTSTAIDTFVLSVSGTPPTISDITNQTTPENTATGPIAFTVGDAETPAASLTVSGSSSDQTLVPDDNLVFGGAGASRTITITPAGSQTGTATITVTVSDGAETATDTVVLTVGANAAPTISDIGNQSTPVDTATGALAFTVSDAETDVASLTVSGSSSDQTVVPTANIVLGGSGASRTVTVTPAASQTGSTTITLTVSDGSLTATDSFVLTVGGNAAPTISAITDQVTPEDTATGAIAFTVSDADTAVADLTVSGSSSDTSLVSTANLIFGGTGATRTVSVTPAADATGTATITVTVSDGTATTTGTFDLTVTAVNDGPTLTAINDQVTGKNTSTGALALTMADVDTPLASLTMAASSSNQSVVTDAQIVDAHVTPSDVTLTVTPATDATGTTTITVTVSDGAASETTSFDVTVMQGYELTISQAGSGTGRVVSDPAGIDCGGTCTAEFSGGVPVTLEPQPDAGSVFAGWTGPHDCVHGTLTLGSDLSCIARFTVQTVFSPSEQVDFNGDGLTDVQWYQAATGEWGQEFADGAGGFSRQHGFVGLGWTVTLGDFDGNGLTDVLLYNPATGAWRQALTDGRGGFSYHDGQWAAGWELLSLLLNGDLRTDVLLYNPATGAQYGALTTGPGSFVYTQETWAAGWEITRAHWTAGSAHDLFLYNPTSGAWGQLTNDTTGRYHWTGTQVPAGTASLGTVQGWSPGWTIVPANLDGNGLTDLLLYERTSGVWIEAFGTGGGFTFQSGQWGPGWTVRVADITGNGQDDVFLYDQPTGAWVEARNVGVGQFDLTQGTWLPGYALHIMQLDDNAPCDMLLYEATTGNWHTGLRTGPGTYTPAWGGTDHTGLALITQVPATLHVLPAPAPLPMLTAAP